MWTLDELCAVVRTTPATVHTWRKNGRAPKAYKIGRHLLFAEADIRTWLKARAEAASRMVSWASGTSARNAVIGGSTTAHSSVRA